MSAMAEKRLIMLKHVDQTPVLAGCSGCKLKFFVPKGLMKAIFQANNYLLSKFDRHVCTGKESAAKKAVERHDTRDSSWQHWPGSCRGQKL